MFHNAMKKKTYLDLALIAHSFPVRRRFFATGEPQNDKLSERGAGVRCEEMRDTFSNTSKPNVRPTPGIQTQINHHS
jgi:hypothetical protein